MTTVNSTTAYGTTATGGTASGTKAASSTPSLGQKDFLTLLTAQMQNQDPLSPMQSGEFLAQMAQFSTVAGINQVNDTLTSMGSGMRDFRIATATNLLGHSVLVPGSVTRADADGAVQGAVDLPEAATSVVVTYSNANTGEILNTQTLGAQPAGLTGFKWDSVPTAVSSARTPIRVSITAMQANGAQDIGPSVYAKVLSARTDATGQNVTLDVEDYGALDALQIDSFR